MRFTDNPAGPTIGSNSSFLPLKRGAAESARLIAPSVASSSRLAAGVSTASSQIPTATAPDQRWSGSAKLISIATSKIGTGVVRTRSATEIAIDRTGLQVNVGD